MLISKNWINDFVNIEDIDDHELANDFTMKTAEVEAVLKHNDHLSKIFVAEIQSLRPHPEADKLNLVTIDFGKSSKEVVCGASNVRVGLKIPYAPLGVTLPNGLTLEAKKIRGILSEGMLCSAVELGLGEESSGLLELPADYKVGEPIYKAMQLELDTIIDVDNKSITHRPDLWGIYGQAREFSAIYERELKSPYDESWQKKLESHFNNKPSPIQVSVSSDSSCKAFWGLSVDGIEVSESPDWLKKRIEALGGRSINSIVDISNYVMMELGIPLHIYDRDLISGNKINISLSGKEQKFKTLDEIEREIIASDTMISDEEKNLVLAGIMGGASSGVQDETNKVFIEVANWLPESVRQTSVRLGLRTDSSSRYEKSLDSKACYKTLLRTLDLILKLNPNAEVIGQPVYDGDDLTKIETKKIQTDLKYINNILGTKLDTKRVQDILESLDFKVKLSGDAFDITVPSFRATKDIDGAHDISEEIGRIIGYDSIDIEAPLIAVKPLSFDANKKFERKVQDFMVYHANCLEITTYPLIGKKLLEQVSWPELNEDLELINSLSEDADRMRPSLIPSSLEVCALNAKNFEHFSFFEWGRSYHNTKNVFCEEKKVLNITLYSKKENRYLELVNIVEKLFKSLGIANRFVSTDKLRGDNPLLANWVGTHPNEKEHLMVTGKVSGACFSVHPLVLKKLKLKGNVAMCSVDLTAFTQRELNNKKSYKALEKFPDSTFECSVLAPKRLLTGELISLAQKVKIKDLKTVKLLSTFDLSDDQKSVTLKFTFGNKSKTLDSEAIKSYEDTVVSHLLKAGYPLKS